MKTAKGHGGQDAAVIEARYKLGLLVHGAGHVDGQMGNFSKDDSAKECLSHNRASFRALRFQTLTSVFYKLFPSKITFEASSRVKQTSSRLLAL